MRPAPNKNDLTPAQLRSRTVAGGNGDWGEIAGIQRGRMLAAMIEVAARDGLANASVAHVVARAGVSRRTFYEVFTDREDCFLAAFDDALERTTHEVLTVYNQHGEWIDRVRAGLTALLDYFDDQPAMARLLVIESLAAGPKALDHRTTITVRLASLLEEGAGTAHDTTPLAAEGTIGAVLAIIHTRLAGTQPPRLIELRNPLMATIALPYLGASAAQRELEQPVPKRKRRSIQTGADKLSELQMRLTYRTLRVLAAIAADPGASNRALAEHADITDQGQISKLLARLERLNLIHNTRTNTKRGDPNAWHLTTTGTRVQNALVGQAPLL